MWWQWWSRKVGQAGCQPLLPSISRYKSVPPACTNTKHQIPNRPSQTQNIWFPISQREKLEQSRQCRQYRQNWQCRQLVQYRQFGQRLTIWTFSTIKAVLGGEMFERYGNKLWKLKTETVWPWWSFPIPWTWSCQRTKSSRPNGPKTGLPARIVVTL